MALLNYKSSAKTCLFFTGILAWLRTFFIVKSATDPEEKSEWKLFSIKMTVGCSFLWQRWVLQRVKGFRSCIYHMSSESGQFWKHILHKEPEHIVWFIFFFYFFHTNTHRAAAWSKLKEERQKTVLGKGHNYVILLLGERWWSLLLYWYINGSVMTVNNHG